MKTILVPKKVEKTSKMLRFLKIYGDFMVLDLVFSHLSVEKVNELIEELSQTNYCID